MKNMDFIRLGKRAISLSLLLTLISATSMFTLASPSKPIGELIVTGGNSDGASVTVNGEPAKSGRTVFASSTITTPEGTSVVVNMGKAGKIELGPNTTFSLDGDGNVVSGNLTAGSVTLAGSENGIDVVTLSGETVALSNGETAMASSARAARDHRDSTGKCIDDDKDGKEECGLAAIPPWGWAAIIGGVALVVVLIATSGDDDNPTSPIR